MTCDNILAALVWTSRNDLHGVRLELPSESVQTNHYSGTKGQWLPVTSCFQLLHFKQLFQGKLEFLIQMSNQSKSYDRSCSI